MENDSISAVTLDVAYRDVVGFPGYRVGDDGSVWTNHHWNGRSPSPGAWRPLKLKRHRHGYPAVILSRDGRPSTRLVHRLVMEAFVGPRPPGLVCCHNDGNPANNHLSNLRYDTPSANQRDRALHGTAQLGSENPMAVLHEIDVLMIRTLNRRYGILPGVIASLLHFNRSTVGNVLSRQRNLWRHVPAFGEDGTHAVVN